MIHNPQYGFNKLPMGEHKDIRSWLSNPYVKQRRKNERVAKSRLREMEASVWKWF